MRTHVESAKGATTQVEYQTISGDAEVQVLRRHGFETGVKGKNGFACIVERSWTGIRGE